MKKLSYIVILVTAIFVLSCSGDLDKSIAQNKPGGIDSTKKIEKVSHKNFILTFDEGLEKATKENKKVLVDFYTDWCGWCKVMDEKTFNDKEIIKKLNERFITVRINAEDSRGTATFKGQTFNNIELTRAFRISGFPSLAFISPEYEVITVIPGYIPADKFISILDYIDKECYKKQISFEEFMKNKGECGDRKDTKNATNN